jgi:hypothetical protein
MNPSIETGRWPSSSTAHMVGRRPVVSWWRKDSFNPRKPQPPCSPWASTSIAPGSANLPLTPTGIWNFYYGRAGLEPRVRELREDFALRKIPTASFAANALYLEIVRLAYNLATAFQRNCLDESWQNLTLPKLRYKLFLIPGELSPQNRPLLRLRPSPMIESLAETILARVRRLKALPS